MGGEYRFNIEPQNLDQQNQTDGAAMITLQQLIPVPSTRLIVQSGNRFEFISNMGFSYDVQFSPQFPVLRWQNYLTVINTNGPTLNVPVTIEMSTSGFYQLHITHAR